MGLRCLLSHDFGEPELEREREEQGNEVIITVNEVKTCSRCGERRIVSENTEVTSMAQLTATATDEAADAGSEPAAPEPSAQGASAAASPSQAEPTAADPAGSDDFGVTIDDSVSMTDDAEVWTNDDDDSVDDGHPSDGEPDDLGATTTANMTVDDVESAAAESVDPATAEAADSVDAAETAEDDGIILPNETDEPEAEAPNREPGEWPEYDSEDVAADDEAAWPDVEGDDEGFAAENPAEEPEDMTFGGGFTPEITKSEAGSVPDSESELSFTRAEESEVEFEPTVDDIQTEFYCPECGLARLSGNSSMRAGDICPDCKRGYISERPT